MIQYAFYAPKKHEMKISNMLYFSDISIFVWRTKHNSVDFGYGVLKKEIFNLIKIRQTAENRIFAGWVYRAQLVEKQAEHIISAR